MDRFQGIGVQKAGLEEIFFETVKFFVLKIVCFFEYAYYKVSARF